MSFKIEKGIPVTRPSGLRHLAAVAAFVLILTPNISAAVERPEHLVLKWQDKFSGDKLDNKKWRTGLAPSNQVKLRSGNLILTASGTSATDRRAGSVRSADTAHLNGWKGATRKGEKYQGPTFQSEGWLEIRMKASDVRGVMSEIVLWTDYQAIPEDSVDRWVGEIDVAEAKGHKPHEVWVSTHSWFYPGWKAPPINGLQNDTAPITRQRYATYVLWWSVEGAPEDFLRVYVNGYLRHERDLSTAPIEVFGAPFSVTMSCWVVAHGGWGGEQGVDWAKLPAEMQVDYVRFYGPREEERR